MDITDKLKRLKETIINMDKVLNNETVIDFNIEIKTDRSTYNVQAFDKDDLIDINRSVKIILDTFIKENKEEYMKHLIGLWKYGGSVHE